MKEFEAFLFIMFIIFLVIYIMRSGRRDRENLGTRVSSVLQAAVMGPFLVVVMRAPDMSLYVHINALACLFYLVAALVALHLVCCLPPPPKRKKEQAPTGGLVPQGSG